MPIQWAADMAPKGARHSRKGPETRSARRSPPPPCAWAACAARTPKVDSQTVRKQRTWRQRPDATAMAAAMTDPQGLFDGGDAALAHASAGGAGVGRQAVDVVEREPRVSDRLQAGVDGQR